MAHDPNYVPTGANNRANAYNEKDNNVKLARDACNRAEFIPAS
jgi:hypothetical protein